MNLIYFIVFSLIIFMTIFLGYKKFLSTTLYALAIGGVVNANFFNAWNYPIDVFGLPLAIDSVIYTLFVFCVIVMFIKEDKKSAYILATSSIIAIMFSALMQLISDLLSKGSSFEVWKNFLTFTISAVASVVAIIVMLEVLNKIKEKCNSYLITIIGISIAIVIYSIIYYSLATLLNGVPDNILMLLLGSVIGKIIALGCSILTIFIINRIDKKEKNNLNL